MSFLTLDNFLDYFDPIEISRTEFIKQFRVTYKGNPTLEQIFCLSNIENRKSVIKSVNDFRYVNRELIIDYFYDIVVENREKYLTQFYHSYFGLKDPYAGKWNINPLVKMAVTNKGSDQTGSNVDCLLFREYNQAKLVEQKETFLNEILELELPKISVQKNDSLRIMIRNLNYLDILHTTKILNTSKHQVSFWQTLIGVYNHLTLEDRFFAPSSIGLYLRTKKDNQINYNNFFYLFQQYQPKASILNPYTIYWLLENYFTGDKLFTPVLSWSSYLVAFYHSRYQTYVGIDVIPRVCERARSLVQYYSKLRSENRKKQVEIYCQRSETFLQDSAFLSKYQGYFDTVLWCPPYFNMEIYEGSDQSTEMYPEYRIWLEKYFRETIKLVELVTTKKGLIGIIMNDYYLLNGSYYPLIRDFNLIAGQFFDLINIFELVNRTSPLRVNKKNRTERLFVYRPKNSVTNKLLR